MFGFKSKELSEEQKVETCWKTVKDLYGSYLPRQLFKSEKFGTEGKLFGLINIYPVLRFMCPNLQREDFFKAKVLADGEVLSFYDSLDHEVVLDCLDTWWDKNVRITANAILEQEGLLGKNSAAETLRRQQLILALSRDNELLTKRAAAELKFLPKYIKRAMEADFEHILGLELSRPHQTSNQS